PDRLAIPGRLPPNPILRQHAKQWPLLNGHCSELLIASRLTVDPQAEILSFATGAGPPGTGFLIFSFFPLVILSEVRRQPNEVEGPMRQWSVPGFTKFSLTGR